jgi:hypothetical protein
MAGYIGNDPAKSSVRIARQTYTTTGSQTDFTFSAGYDPGYIEIYVNGVRQTEGTNFTANDGSVFSILNGIGAGNTVTAAAYKAFNVASVSLSEVTDVDDLSVTGQITGGTGYIGINTFNADGSVTTGIVTASSFVGDGSGLTGVASTDNITTSTPAEFQQINVSGIATVGVATLSTSVVVGNAVTVTSSAITVDPAVTATINGDVNFQGGNYNISRSRTNSSIDFDDNAKARFGTGADMSIYFDGTNSAIDANAGGILNVTNNDFRLKTSGGETMLRAQANDTVEIMFDNSVKLATKTDGVTVTGDVTATTFTGSGANLTNLPASGDSNDITACLFI